MTFTDWWPTHLDRYSEEVRVGVDERARHHALPAFDAGIAEGERRERERCFMLVGHFDLLSDDYCDLVDAIKNGEQPPQALACQKEGR